MSRAKATDFLHSFRFHVVLTIPGGGGPGGTADNLHSKSSDGKVSAGFNACSAPEVSHDAVEYREGHYIYTRKMVGLPTVSDISLSRGVALTDGTFWLWMKDVIEGNAEYRADVDIYHYHRDSKPATTSGQTTVEMLATTSTPPGGYIHYKCREAFPISHKVAGDLDATSSEVSIQEMSLAMEYFDVEVVPGA